MFALTSAVDGRVGAGGVVAEVCRAWATVAMVPQQGLRDVVAGVFVKQEACKVEVDADSLTSLSATHTRTTLID